MWVRIPPPASLGSLAIGGRRRNRLESSGNLTTAQPIADRERGSRDENPSQAGGAQLVADLSRMCLGVVACGRVADRRDGHAADAGDDRSAGVGEATGAAG